MKYYIILSKIFFVLFMSIILHSCKNNLPNNEYFNEMNNYFNKVHKINIKNIQQEKQYLLVNLNCLDCLGRNNFEQLKDLNNETLNFIFVGKTSEKEIQEIISEIEKKHPVFFDPKNKAFLYELNFAKAILVKTKNSEIIQYDVYHGLSIKQIKADLVRA